MNWISLESIEQLNEIKSAAGFSIIFKHSTRCSISFMAKKKFEFEWDSLPEETPVYFLDLLNHRNISNSIADIFQVPHESPQLLLIKDGECIFESSHGEISAEEAAEQMTVNS
ncbi:bacillithiol system redox-active protein YtxJ [Pedobacter sp. SYSU D00535]|uniref:bacillithiol system redox-active protein YtxJ n=1 Tax=Pedobacter sp. SYSU D00535 TaxID=2810308 RepID=UPI001A962416|nr:bacillithiol system redox-active protein YtxJ [Pedobacter sp. SYSU D00535]